MAVSVIPIATFRRVQAAVQTAGILCAALLAISALSSSAEPVNTGSASVPVISVEPRLDSIQVQSNRIRFVLTGRVDGKYLIERSETLNSWTMVSTNTLPASGSSTVEISGSTTNRSAFFRAREDLSSVILLDRFERADSPSVGGNWSENDQSNLLSIRSGTLRLNSNADRAAYIRVSGGAQTAVKLTFSFYINARNGSEVIQIGTKGRSSSGSDTPYRDCFGFAILPSFGIQPNDTAFQGSVTPFRFADATVYAVEILIFADASREIRVWESSESRPTLPTLFTPAQLSTRASGSRYQIGFDSGSSGTSDILIDDFRVEPFNNSKGTRMILADSFERPNSPTVGGDWQETDPSNVLSLEAARLKASSNADRSGYIRAAGGLQTGVVMSFTLEVVTKNDSQALVFGTRAGSLIADNPYRDCFGFAILPSLGVIANDTQIQGDITPFAFEEGARYSVELFVFTDNSRELRVWPSAGARPNYPTAFALPQLVTAASGSKYHIGFDAGSASPSALLIDEFRIESTTNTTGTAQLLFDGFERTDSSSIGGPWKETDPDNLLSLAGGTLRLNSNADRSAYLRAFGTTQTGVKLTFSVSILGTNQTEVIQVGTKGGGGKDNPYRDCFGFAILPSRGVQANDTTFQGAVTPYPFMQGRTYQIEVRIAQNNSRELRVWPDGSPRPSAATLAVSAQPGTLALGLNYQIGYDSGSSRPAEYRIDNFRAEKISP